MRTGQGIAQGLHQPRFLSRQTFGVAQHAPKVLADVIKRRYVAYFIFFLLVFMGGISGRRLEDQQGLA